MSEPEFEVVDEVPAPFPPPGWWRAWAVMLALGWLVFEITAQPRYGIAVTCAKFGWNDFQNGFWWWRADRRHARGLAGGLLCWSRGVYKWAAGAITICVLLMLCLDAMTPNGAQANSNSWAISLVIGVLLLTVAAILSGASCTVALLGGVRLWLDGGLTGSRRRGVFPPDPRGSNVAHHLILSFVAIGSMLLCGIASVAFNQKDLVVLWVPMAIVGAFTSRQALARFYSQCWPEAELS
jgi:hypothetical protein